MNGRIYDPLTARFMSADPILQDPMNGQSYNRYSYVMNNPTNLTDPTGFCANSTESRFCAGMFEKAEKWVQDVSTKIAGMGEAAQASVMAAASKVMNAAGFAALSEAVNQKTEAATPRTTLNGTEKPDARKPTTASSAGVENLRASAAQFRELSQMPMSWQQTLIHDPRPSWAETAHSQEQMADALEGKVDATKLAVAVGLGILRQQADKKGAQFISPTIHAGQQGKHIPGHNNQIPGRSTLNPGVDAQKLLDGVHSGTYKIVSQSARGQPVVDFGRVIGMDAASGLPTRYGTVHSGKGGAHIVPANPKLIEGK
jgi:hypothetical protein